MLSTRSMEWLTSSTVVLSVSTSSLMRFSHLRWKRKSPTLSVSSTIRMSGSVTVAMAKAMRATMPEL